MIQRTLLTHIKDSSFNYENISYAKKKKKVEKYRKRSIQSRFRSKVLKIIQIYTIFFSPIVKQITSDRSSLKKSSLLSPVLPKDSLPFILQSEDDNSYHPDIPLTGKNVFLLCWSRTNTSYLTDSLHIQSTVHILNFSTAKEGEATFHE